jgi:hypothetical protein
MGDMVEISSTARVSSIEWSHLSIGLAFVALNVAISYVLKVLCWSWACDRSFALHAQLMMVATVL